MDKVSAINFFPQLPERRQRGRRAPAARPKDGDRDDRDSMPLEDGPGQPRVAYKDIPISGGENLRVEVDPASGRLTYLAVAPSTGEVLREYTADEALGRIRRCREVAGLAIDTKS